MFLFLSSNKSEAAYFSWWFTSYILTSEYFTSYWDRRVNFLNCSVRVSIMIVVLKIFTTAGGPIGNIRVSMDTAVTTVVYVAAISEDGRIMIRIFRVPTRNLSPVATLPISYPHSIRMSWIRVVRSSRSYHRSERYDTSTFSLLCRRVHSNL